MLKSELGGSFFETAGRWSRRWVVAAIAAVFVAPAAPALALEVEEARTLVEEVSAEINTLATSNDPTAVKRAAFEKVLRDRSDVNRIARLTLGKEWRNMSDAQKSAYTDAFIDYVANRFVKSFADFNGGEVAITKAAPADSPREPRVLVSSVGTRAEGGAPIKMDWVIIELDGKATILDLKVEAVSLVVNQRAEIAAILQGVGGDYDQLIAKLREAVANSI